MAVRVTTIEDTGVYATAAKNFVELDGQYIINTTSPFVVFNPRGTVDFQKHDIPNGSFMIEFQGRLYFKDISEVSFIRVGNYEKFNCSLFF